MLLVSLIQLIRSLLSSLETRLSQLFQSVAGLDCSTNPTNYNNCLTWVVNCSFVILFPWSEHFFWQNPQNPVKRVPILILHWQFFIHSLCTCLNHLKGSSVWFLLLVNELTLRSKSSWCFNLKRRPCHIVWHNTTANLKTHQTECETEWFAIKTIITMLVCL